MKERLLQLQERIDARNLRERILILLLAVGLLVMLWDTLLLAPQQREQQRLLERTEQARQSLTELDRQLQELVQQSRQDPNAENRRLQARFQQRSQELDSEIRRSVEGLVEPTEMARLLREVLARQKSLRLVRIDSLPATSLLDVGEGEASAGTTAIYRHGMRLELEGSYLDTLAYLRDLQALPWALRWDGLAIETVSYPTARVVLTVYTLSLSEEWIGV